MPNNNGVNFFDDFVKEFEKKKDNKFEDVKNFVLSEYVYDKNNCLYCCTGKCTKHENNEKAKDLHPKIKNIIKNPKHLLGGDIKKTLDENNMDVHDKSIHMNTCVYNYKHPICKNCDDGRCKRMNHNGIELKICWPKLREESSVIPIGLHWDFSIEIKNNEIVDKHTKIKVYDGLFEKNQNKYRNRNFEKKVPNIDECESSIIENRKYLEKIKEKEKVNFNLNDEDEQEISDINENFPKLVDDNRVSPTNNHWAKIAKTRVKTPDEEICSNNSYEEHIDISETNSTVDVKSPYSTTDSFKKMDSLDSIDEKSSTLTRKESVDTMSEVIYSNYDKKINDLKKENSLLIKENTQQKDHIKNLKAVISYDKKTDFAEISKNKEIDNLKSENEKYLEEINDLNKSMKKLKAKLIGLESRVPEKTFSEEDKKNMIENCRSFSESLFKAMRENTNYL